MKPKSVASVAAALLGVAGLVGVLPSALAAAGPPANTSLPTITGTLTQGQTLTASTGSWSRKPTSYAYQWQRCNASGGACVSIGGATAKTYTLTSSEVGGTVRVVVTASNSSGSGVATSAATAVVQAPPTAPANTSLPTIGGTLQDGQTLTAAPGSWTGTAPIGYAYQWQRCNSDGTGCGAISGATASTYTATGADVGGTLAVAVTASNTAGSSTATSTVTTIVQPAPPLNTSLPTISGTAQDGQTLTASTGSWSGTAPIGYAYQWLSCDTSGNNCNQISGATASTYTLTSTDVGTTLRVQVTASNAAAPGGVNATSAASTVVQSASAPPANTSLPTISGTAQDGQTLTATSGSWTGTQPIGYAYQWQRCNSAGTSCNQISGATATTYTATSNDVGSTLEVTVTASNTAGSTAATSAATAIVQLSPPTNTSPPTISGTSQDGQTLTASNGSWSSPLPMTYTYQWQRCDPSGNNCNPIQDAVVATYTATSGDVGSTLEVTVTASNSDGSTSASSAPTPTVQGAPPVDNTLPAITGTPQAGLTMNASTGTWTGTTPMGYAYQWQRCDTSGNNCNQISGATASTYTPTGTDAGNTLRVAVTASNTVSSATATSAPTALVQGSATAGATTVFSDGFESGNFNAWSTVQTGGDGTAVVQSSTVKSGTYAAQLSESANSGSKADVRKTLSPALQDLTTIGDFDITQQGPTGTGNVPLFRFFDSSSNRVVNMYRQNVSSGTSSTIYVNYGGTAYATTGKPTVGTWATVGIHLIINGAASTVTITLNGTQIYSTTTANLGTAGISTIQIGNETAAQQFTTLVDNVSVQTGTVASTPPANTSPPTITGTPQSGQTLNANPGTWSGSQPINYSYQWQRCDSSGNNCNPVSGATGSSYLLTGSDVGATLDVIVTASNSAGGSTATSTATAVIQPGSLPPNTVALWHMDETSGTTMFDSAGNHNGTLFNVQTGLPGWNGNAYGFNGASSYVSVPSSPQLNPGSANITMTIHLKTTGSAPPPPADWDIFRKGLYTSVGGEYKMEFQQNGQASCGFEGSGGYAEIQGGPALNDGSWHTISCVKTATQIQLNVDGTLVASKNATIGTIAPSDPVVIGARPGSDWYQGQLDEASIQIG